MLYRRGHPGIVVFCCLSGLAAQTSALARARGATGGWSFSETRAAPLTRTRAAAANFKLVSGPRARIRRLLNRAARHYRISPRLVRAVARQESDFHPRAVSSKGALGVMQLMPRTARELRVARPFDAAQNIDGGVRFLRDLLARYHGNRRLALAAYNAGPGAVDRFGGIPPYAETQHYIRAILQHLRPPPASAAARPAARISPARPQPAAPPIVLSRSSEGGWVFSNTD